MVQSCITKGQISCRPGQGAVSGARGGRFIAPRSCSSTARPGGTRMQSLGGQEPLVSDQIHQLQCYKKEGKEIKGFSMLEKVYWCWLLQLCLPRRVQQAIFPSQHCSSFSSLGKNGCAAEKSTQLLSRKGRPSKSSH